MYCWTYKPHHKKQSENDGLGAKLGCGSSSDKIPSSQADGEIHVTARIPAGAIVNTTCCGVDKASVIETFGTSPVWNVPTLQET